MRGKLLLLALTAPLVLAFAAGDARAAAGDPFDDVPAIAAYVEDIPSAGGRRKTTAKPRTVRSIPAPVERQLGSGADDQKLREVVTSSRYGASEPAPRAERRRVAEVIRGEDVEAAGPLGASVSAATSGPVHLQLLLVFVLLSTAAAVALAGYRARSGR